MVLSWRTAKSRNSVLLITMGFASKDGKIPVYQRHNESEIVVEFFALTRDEKNSQLMERLDVSSLQLIHKTVGALKKFKQSIERKKGLYKKHLQFLRHSL